jgi:hypothetical protein
VTARAASARACVLAISIGAVMLAACGGSGATGTRAADPKPPAGAVLRDPAGSGPYGVRLTKMTFERPANVTKDDRYAHYPREDVAPGAAIVHDAAATRN